MKSFLSYAIKRLGVLIPFLIGITLISFIVGIVAPGDPALAILTMDGVSEPTAEELNAVRHSMGLDQPLRTQYFLWLKNAVKGDLGRSYMTGKAVLQEIMNRFPITVNLAVWAMGWVIFLGIPVGIWSARKDNQKKEILVRIITLFFISVPNFWLAIILILFFSEELYLLPSSGYGSVTQMIMPSFVLAAGTAAAVIRMQKTTAREVMQQLFILTERAKGLSEKEVLWKHVLPNSLMPVITMLGTFFGSVLGGSVIVEDLFAIPGMGSYVLNAIWSRDYPVIQGYVIISGTVFLLFNYLVDLSYYALNPAVRTEEKE